MKRWKQYRSESLWLTAAGAALFLGVDRGRITLTPAALSDLLFSTGSVFLIWGLIHQVNNWHMFTSFAWGTKVLKKLITNKKLTDQDTKEGYEAYRDSRPHRDDVGYLLVIGAVLICVSFAVLALGR